MSTKDPLVMRGCTVLCLGKSQDLGSSGERWVSPTSGLSQASFIPTHTSAPIYGKCSYFCQFDGPGRPRMALASPGYFLGTLEFPRAARSSSTCCSWALL